MSDGQTVAAQIHIVKADYHSPKHAQAIIDLLKAYALDPMGGGEPLSTYTINNLVSELSQRDYAFSVLAFHEDKAVGLINCFEAFSTFACKPLVNIHDVIVLSEYRGLGISLSMLLEVERIALNKGCCKITLEVLENNLVAKQAYQSFGFSAYQLDPEAGNALFWQKSLKA